jgi:hypothetical protein
MQYNDIHLFYILFINMFQHLNFVDIMISDCCKKTASTLSETDVAREASPVFVCVCLRAEYVQPNRKTGNRS